MKQYRSFVRRVSPVVILIVLLVSGYLLFTVSGHQLLADLLNSRPLLVTKLDYICPLIDQPTVVEVATCTDCTFYPVDKAHQLPATYAPKVVDSGLPGGGKVTLIAKTYLTLLFADAERQGLSPTITSAYRSYADQARVFSAWFAQERQQTANPLLAFLHTMRYSALPGYSEHQLGTAVDINCQHCIPFDTQNQKNIALWSYLEENAHRYGFVVSYPRNTEQRTGYQYEPWHIRYIGVEAATELFQQGYTAGNGACELTLLRARKLY